MKAIGNMKIGVRLAFGFGVVLLCIIGLGMLSLGGLSASNDELRKIATDDMVKLEATLNMEAATRANAHRIFELVVATDPAQQKQILERMKVNNERIQKNIEKLEGLIKLDKGKDLLASVKKANAEVSASYVKAQGLVASGKRAEAVSYVKEDTDVLVSKLIERLIQLEGLEKEVLEAAVAHSSQVYLDLREKAIALMCLSIFLGALIAWAVTRSISRPLRDAVKVANAVAGGDLTSRIEASGKDEIGELMTSISVMQERLVGIVGGIRDSSESIGTASRQIAAGNLDLSSRTEEQASNLEETASAMEQLTATVRQNAENARQANQLAAGASEVAQKGGAVVGNVVSTMSEISASSRKIADIIGVIDGIAFQTNILALNAAVEAARAGDQGRGFAVVASEVRSLAQRSANAAKEIKGLIENSVSKVEAGGRLVDEAGRTMADVVAQVKRVTDIMAEISAASQEQSSGIEQVNQSITQMDQVTQQNAALVEESAAAADAMRAQADALATAVAVFTLDRIARESRTTPVRSKTVDMAEATPSSAPIPKSSGRRLAAPKNPVASATPQVAAPVGVRAEGWESF